VLRCFRDRESKRHPELASGALLRRFKRLAADRDASVSSFLTEGLAQMADEDRRYSAARKQSLAAMRSARSLGTGGRRTCSRDEIHAR
jgi:hypothetical protein